jgi:DNA-binding transcriptional ArsR family regulator
MIGADRPLFRRRPQAFRCIETEIRLRVKAAGKPACVRPPLACRQCVCYILNHMVQYTQTYFNASFAALSDATRRGVLEQLGRADASITDLADKFHMTLTGMKKHVVILEHAGLVTTEKVGRVRTCKLGLRRLEEETTWIENFRKLWDARFGELDKVVEELKWKEKIDGRKKRK